MPDDTLWDADPHTFMKHHILRKYLDAWYPVGAYPGFPECLGVERIMRHRCSGWASSRSRRG